VASTSQEKTTRNDYEIRASRLITIGGHRVPTLYRIQELAQEGERTKGDLEEA